MGQRFEDLDVETRQRLVQLNGVGYGALQNRVEEQRVEINLWRPKRASSHRERRAERSGGA